MKKTDSGSKITEKLPAIHQLWDALAAFPASRIDDALVHFMHWSREHLEVDNVFWLGNMLMLEESVLAGDPLKGWRLRARRQLLPESDAFRKLIASYYATEHYGKVTPAYRSGRPGPDSNVHVGLVSIKLSEGAGTFRAHGLRDGWMDFQKFRRSEHYRLYHHNLGIQDRILVVFPVGTRTESIFLFDRHSRKRFTDRDVELAAFVLRSQREFNRRLLLAHGVYPGVKALSPLKRCLMQELLSGRPEKEIAETLRQRSATMRKTITELYAEFGVKTRPAFMALWLGES